MWFILNLFIQHRIFLMIGVLTILFHVTCKATIPMALLKIAMSYREPIRFCFILIIQRELDNLVFEWNHHNICQSCNAETPEEFQRYCILCLSNQVISSTSSFFVHAIGIIDYRCYINRELLDYGEKT